jgi:hypothetical protein
MAYVPPARESFATPVWGWPWSQTFAKETVKLVIVSRFIGRKEYADNGT